MRLKFTVLTKPHQERIHVMKKFITSIVVLMLVVIVFASIRCTKAPTEKVISLEMKIENLNKPAAEYFAAEEYGLLMRQVEDIRTCMIEKNYSRANVVMDSTFQTLENVHSTLIFNGRKTSQESMDNTKQKLDVLLSLLNDNYDSLVKSKKIEIFEEKYQSYNSRYSALETNLINNLFLRVHNNAQKLAEEIDTTTGRANKLLNTQ